MMQVVKVYFKELSLDVPEEGEENCTNVSNYRCPMGQELNQ
jgi:hypothetical protein